MKIESINNPKVKEWSKLKEKKYRDQNSEFIIEGDHLVNEAIKKGLVKEIIALDSSFEIASIPFYEVTEQIMKKLTNQVSISKVLGIARKLESRPIKGNVCLLDNIQDPGNLGAIIRSANAFNIDTIIMSNDTVDLYNEKVIRASEGMIFHLNFLKCDLIPEIIKLKEKGYTIYGTNVSKGKSLKTLAFKEFSGIIIGNEGKGMSESLISYCDTLINIPLKETCESLNASIAASIIFYEMDR